MICYKCNGTGEYDIYNECPCCNGTGEIDITNEEWIKMMTTEELAEWIVGMSTICTINHECDRCDSWCDEKRVLEWLKEIHNDKQ